MRRSENCGFCPNTVLKIKQPMLRVEERRGLTLDLDVSKMELFAKTRRSTLVSSEQSEELRVVCASYRKSKSHFINGKWQCENKSELFKWEAFNNSMRITDVEFKNNFFSRTLQRYWDRSQRSSFLRCDLTSAGCRQTFTVVFSKFSCCVLITFVVASRGFCQAFQIIFSFLLTFTWNLIDYIQVNIDIFIFQCSIDLKLLPWCFWATVVLRFKVIQFEYFLRSLGICGKPIIPPRGPLILHGNSFLDGDEVKFSCAANHDLFGSQRSQCVGQKWNTRIPECKGRLFSHSLSCRRILEHGLSFNTHQTKDMNRGDEKKK